ncbi:glycosyltransferase family 4 protein [Hoylesella timonensis]|uniref:Glycosyltransferase family 4 protein n=1 Tax=Hoylesella timonensis TaxID=386414 RepID=A0A2N6Q5M8_9BACT|nr:glycosyltransferase family 4 protein [Hoylesella timonensis]PMC10257.1 glycosyltransferase family 4 protein [Hoylesella timonensis]
MKIFIVCSRLSYGGAERVGVMLANGLSVSHSVYLISNTLEEPTYEVKSSVQLLPLFSSISSKIDKWASTLPNIRKYAKTYRPDVIIGIMETCSLVSKLATIGLGIPIIMTEHNAFERPKNTPLTKWQIITKFYINKLYCCVTILTEADKEFIGLRLKNTVVMPNPLFLTPIIKSPVKDKIVLAAGRIDDWHCKGFDILLKAWGTIAKQYPDWTLEIAGDGRKVDLELLQNIVRKSEVENQVKFLGYQKNIVDRYKQSAVFVLSSRYEGFGLVLIEAMSQGCACVACDFKGRQREIIRNDSEGLVCVPNDVDALALAIKKMIDDDMYRQKVQKAAIERSKYYAMDKTIRRWENLLKRLLSDNCL